MSHNDITNILVCGIGGQGVMTATEILAEAAIAEGHDVKKTEVAGMAQRGGVVTSHLRFGRKVLSPQIAPGTVQVLLGFEGAEALRWSHYLRPDGLALVNNARLVPPVVELGLFDYPEDPTGQMRTAGRRVVSFDAMSIALELGEVRLGNTVMLGAIADYLPFAPDVLLACIVNRFARKGENVVDANRRAFAAGREAVAKQLGAGVTDPTSEPAPA
ncbi:MAG: indolepyruvate oxidoreductase subunit beta [Sulfuritalea sp.]|jgi:indolepyruvate ferredoxin oxidoreductase beta subunit|nr:indolepyruvate oxidoreductase subunit beta [Sulfuritalea sp.]